MDNKKSLEDLANSVIDSEKEFSKVEQDMVEVFNPCITFKTKKQQEDAKIIWSTKSIELALDAIKNGLGLKVSPFLKSDTNLRKGNLNFQYTDEETLEILRCKNDVLYFAEKYVQLMTPKGKQLIKLRNYQKRLLKLMQDNRWICLLQSRQSAKCITYTTNISVRRIGFMFPEYITIGEFYYRLLSHTRKLSKKEILISTLYKVYEKSNTFLQNIIIKLISLLSTMVGGDDNDMQLKILNELDASDYEILTDTDWQPLKKVFITRDYEIYQLSTVDGLSIECADLHRVFDYNMNPMYVKDIIPGMRIQTIYGLQEVDSVIHTNTRVNMFDVEVDSPEHRYYSNNILSHNTTTTAIFFCWFLLFNIDKTAAIVAQRENIAAEVYSKIRDIVYHLPFFLKPGAISWTASQFAFDNGCRAVYRPATKDCLQGYSINLLFADEFAYIRNKQAKEFYENVYPTLEADPASRFIICSTPQGRNLYYEIWDRAVRRVNYFIPFRVDWWDVPGRDEKWKEITIANLNGDEAAFNQQYALSFDTGVSNSLDAKTYQWLNKLESNFVPGAFNMGSDWNDYFRWSTKFKYNFKNDFFLMSVDIAEGLGGDADFSTMKIKKLIKTGNNQVIMPTIGIFECNTIQITDFAKVILLMMRKFTHEKVRIVVERNTFGDLLFRDIDNLSDKIPDVEIELETFAKFARREGYKLEKGLRLNSKSKRIGVAAWKEYTDSHIFVETDKPTIAQYREFGKDENGNYRAGVGHDDLVMPDVNAAYYVKSNENGWTEFVQDFIEQVKVDEFNTAVLKKLDIQVMQSLIEDEYEDDGDTDTEYTLLDTLSYIDSNTKSDEYSTLEELVEIKGADVNNELHLLRDAKNVSKHDIVGNQLIKPIHHQTVDELANELLDLV